MIKPINLKGDHNMTAKKKQAKTPTENNTPKVLRSGRITIRPLPFDHPVYTEGLFFVGGRITKAALKEETQKKENKN